MFNNFPHQGKAITIILTIVIGYFIYIEWARPSLSEYENIKPGSFKSYYNVEDWKDTVPEVTGHWWYKDSNNIWHEDNENGRTDSSDYLKK